MTSKKEKKKGNQEVKFPLSSEGEKKGRRIRPSVHPLLKKKDWG